MPEDPMTTPLRAEPSTETLYPNAEAEARYALSYGIPGGPDRLSPQAREIYDRLMAEATKMPPEPEHLPTYEQVMENYARQTRNATVTIAWIVGIFAVLTLIGAIIGAVQVIHAINTINSVGNSIGGGIG